MTTLLHHDSSNNQQVSGKALQLLHYQGHTHLTARASSDLRLMVASNMFVYTAAASTRQWHIKIVYDSLAQPSGLTTAQP